MTNPYRGYEYFGENALNLFHLFVNELDSKIIDGYLNLGGLRLEITTNQYIDEGDDRYKVLEKRVHYNDNIKQFSSFKIKIEMMQGRLPMLKIDHFRNRRYGLFGFPLNNPFLKKEPIICFRKWMEIVVNGRHTTIQVNEFDNFLENQKEARELKYKMEYLRRSSERRPSHSKLNSIISDEGLRSEIFKNGTQFSGDHYWSSMD
jgi:hypothetical protein